MSESSDHIPWVNWYIPIIFLNVKQNLSYVWFLGPSTLGKLILNGIFLGVKQNLSYAWILRPYALGKLTRYEIFLSIKQNIGYA